MNNIEKENIEKDINSLVIELFSEYKNNPLITGDMVKAYRHGVNKMRMKVLEYLENKEQSNEE